MTTPPDVRVCPAITIPPLGARLKVVPDMVMDPPDLRVCPAIMNLKIKGNVEIESAVVVTEEERGVVMACVGAGINALVPLPTAANQREKGIG